MNTSTIFAGILAITILAMVYCEQNGKFPDLFYTENFYECSKNKGNSYCTANMKLVPKYSQSKLWINIEDWSTQYNSYNRTVIHRTLCIPGIYEDYLGKKAFFENRTNQELKTYNLSAQMFSVDCKEENLGTDIRKILIGLAIYIGFILLATIYDEVVNKSKRNSTVDKLLTCFSLTTNLNKLTSDKNPDFQKLKCMQGIRTYQAIMIISGHVVLTTAQLYVKNPSFLEQITINPMTRICIVLYMLLLQTYFMMSSWLLTNQVLEMYKKNGRFSVRDGLVMFLHRVSRFWVPILATLFLDFNLYVTFANGPGNFETTNMLSRTCNNYWWATLFQVNTFLHLSQMCNMVTWSLSIDTQFYIISIVFLYMVLNYHLEIKKCLAYLLIFTYAVNMVLFYQRDFPDLFWFGPKFLNRIYFFHNEVTPVTYFGFWINSGSSLIGIIFGYLYFLRKENTKIDTLDRLCGPTSLTIPLVVLLIGALGSSKLVSVLGPLLKPLFAFGIACGIYGMSRNVIRGWPRLIFENKYAVWLGSFTFSIYLHHIAILTARGANNTSLVEISFFGLAVTGAIDIAQSLALGIFYALIIEQPGINIKKMILPQIRIKNETSKEDCNGYKHENKLK